jgi:uncharacterized protein (TIGR03435 family)
VSRSAGGLGNPDSFRFNQYGLSGEGVTMRDFARYVGGKLGLVAVDHTGLEGVYDFKATWKVEQGPDAREELRSAVMDAIEAQLGLKLVPRKIQVETFVVDHAEKATAN